jgi:hypothetical protein
MKQIILFAAIFLFFFESKAQFIGAKYDSFEIAYETEKMNFYEVKLNNKCGIVDSKGKELIPIVYDKIEKIFNVANEIDPLIHVIKDDFRGVLNLSNNFIVPLSNWIYINNTGPFIYATKKGPLPSNYNSYNDRMDTTFLFNQTGNILLATDKHYEFRSFGIDTCITKDLYFTAKKTNGDDYYDSDYDFFIVKQGQQPKRLFEYSNVEIWPDKMFYVRIHPLRREPTIRNSEPKVFFSTLEGDLITTKGDYTDICCKNMYPRYQAEEYGKFNSLVGRYEDGLNYMIDISGNKISEGYNSSTIIGDSYYREDGYFYKIFNGSSIIPLCPPPLPKSTIQNSSKIATNKTSSPVKKLELFERINSFEDISISAKKWLDNDYKLESYIDFNGKNITGWYNSIWPLKGKYFDKEKNLVYTGGNYEVRKKEQDRHIFLTGIFSLVAKKEILPTKYDEIRFYEDGIYKLRLNDKYGLWFQKDNILIEPIYDEIDEYPNRVKLNGQWGRIEKLTFVPF